EEVCLPVLVILQRCPGRSIQQILVDSTSLSREIIPVLNIVCGIVNLQTFHNLPATIEPDRSTIILIFWSCTIYGNILAGDVISRTFVTRSQSEIALVLNSIFPKVFSIASGAVGIHLHFTSNQVGTAELTKSSVKTWTILLVFVRNERTSLPA